MINCYNKIPLVFILVFQGPVLKRFAKMKKLEAKVFEVLSASFFWLKGLLKAHYYDEEFSLDL